MSSISGRTKYVLAGAAIVAIAAVTGWRVHAQTPVTPLNPQPTAMPGQGPAVTVCDACGQPVNTAPNPYKTIENFFPLPDDRKWGSTSLVDIDRDGKGIWAVDRCGANSCVADAATGSLNPEDIIFEFDGATGKVLKHFGGGMIVMPHGMYVDKDDNVWVTDNSDNAPRAARGAPPAGGAAPAAGGAAPAAGGGRGAAGAGGGRGGRGGGAAAGGAAPAQAGAAPAARGAAPEAAAAGRGAAAPPSPGVGATKGHQVFKFSNDGKLLMTIGKEGGSLTECCFQPNDVIVAPDGSIFVSQGHNDAGGPQVVWKFDKNGKPIKPFGSFGHGRLEFDQPHSMAFDAAGRLYVADRNNNRIQIFDQNGYLLDIWYQFSRPSGIFIDKHDILYSADSESQAVSRNHLGWQNGIRIGSVKDGKVIAFIPDPANPPMGTSAAEGVAADDAGNIYGAEVGPRALKKYVKK